MNARLLALITLGFLPLITNANYYPTKMDKKEDTIPGVKEKDSNLTRLIMFTISQIEENDRNRSVIIYSKARFSGQSFELNSDWSANYHHTYWNDEIASIKVPKGLEVWIYEHRNFQGQVLCISGDWSVRDNPWWRDRISSVRLVYTSDRERSKRHKRHHHHDHHLRDCHYSDGVILYEDHHFSGRTLTLFNDWTGGYKDDFWNDRISSIYIPFGYTVILYKHQDFRGRSLTLEGPKSVKLDKDYWNDEVSSIKIRLRKCHHDGSHF